jgi:hypothetical protein
MNNQLAPVIKYKEHTFTVRPDALGVSEQLQQIISEYNFQSYLRDKPYLGEPEFREIQDIFDNITLIYQDSAMQNALLKDASTQEKKKIREIIKINADNIKSETEKLKEPRLARLYEVWMGDRAIYDMSFRTNPVNIRALAEAYLEPPNTNGTAHAITEFIDFEKKDADYFKLAEELMKQFFFTRTEVQLHAVKL